MFRLFPVITVLIFIISDSTAAFGLTLSLSEIAPRVKSRHPQLKAARMAIEEAKGRQLGAGRLPNPTTGFEFQNESQVSPMSATFSLDQSFPITRRLSIEKQHSAQLVEAAALEVRDAERRLIAEAQELAVRILAINHQRSLRQQQKDLARKLADFVKGRADAGELSALDAAQAQVDAQRLLMEARKLEAENISLIGNLKPMLGLSPSDTLVISGQLPKPAVAGMASWTRRPDYQLAQTKIAAAQTEVELAKARKWQDMSAGIFASKERQGSSGGDTEHTGYVGFRISIPWPLWNRNEGEIAEKKASEERALLEREALAKQISSEADTARREMQAYAQFAKETRDDLLPLVIEQTSQLEKAYEAGQTDLLTVLRTREQRLQLEAAALDAERDFHLARIRYEAATGKHAPVFSSPKNP